MVIKCLEREQFTFFILDFYLFYFYYEVIIFCHYSMATIGAFLFQKRFCRGLKLDPDLVSCELRDSEHFFENKRFLRRNLDRSNEKIS